MSEFIRYVKALEPVTSRVRTDITALKKEGKMIWTKDNLTLARTVRHIEGTAARGCCPIKAGENTVQCAVLDFDSHKGETNQADMFKAAQGVAQRLADFDGLFANPWRSSGGRGIHLIYLWNTPQDAYSVRCLLAEALADCGFENGTGGVAKGEIEIFPKQDSVTFDGYGSQFILPLTGKSEPIDLELGIELGRERVLDHDFEWLISHGVAKREKPVRSPSKPPSDDLAKWVQYLYAIDPSELNYEEWLEKVGFALHYESDGSDEGFDLWDEWSAQSSKYTTTEYGRYKWESIKNDKANNVTGQTLINLARSFDYNLDYLNDFSIEPTHGKLDGACAGHDDKTLDGRATGIVQASDFGDRGEFDAYQELVQGVPFVGEREVLKETGEVSAVSTVGAAMGEVRQALPNLKRNKNGEAEAIKQNVRAVISRSDMIDWKLNFDDFRAEIIRQDKNGKWQAFTDTDYFELGELLETRWCFRPVPDALLRNAVAYVASKNRFDTAIHWIENLEPWDGVERIDRFYVDYMKADDTPYVRAVGAYTWTGLAARVLSPGCQLDMVPILEGAQGVRKTSAVKAMVPSRELFCGVSFGEKDDDLARKMRGRLIAEIGELRGLHSRELEVIKEFVTRTEEIWVPKFKEFGTSFARRLMFIGTTNQSEFLADDSGNRRWLPVHVRFCDVDAIIRDRTQLWAEAKVRYEREGMAFSKAEQLAGIVHEKYMIHDGWQDVIEAWLGVANLDGKCPADQDFLLISDILRDALLFDLKQIKRSDEIRVGKILRVLGYERFDRRVGGKVRKVWGKGVALLV